MGGSSSEDDDDDGEEEEVDDGGGSALLLPLSCFYRFREKALLPYFVATNKGFRLLTWIQVLMLKRQQRLSELPNIFVVSLVLFRGSAVPYRLLGGSVLARIMIVTRGKMKAIMIATRCFRRLPLRGSPKPVQYRRRAGGFLLTRR